MDGCKVRQRRDRIGLSAVELAGRVGISRTYLYQIESGKRVPSLKMAYRLADVLLCKVTDIFSPPMYSNRVHGVESREVTK